MARKFEINSKTFDQFVEVMDANPSITTLVEVVVPGSLDEIDSQDMLGSDEFYWFTIQAAPADGIHEMTNNEIIKYGMLTSPIE